MKKLAWLLAIPTCIFILLLSAAPRALRPALAAGPAAGAANAPAASEPATTRGPAATGRGRGAPTAGGAPPSTTQPVEQDARRHATFMERIKQGNIDLLFEGDSITDFFYGANPRNPLMTGRQTWDRYIAPLNAADFAISGARTQNVLWQFQNGELDGFKAKVIVMMIGTNNISAKNTPGETVEGIKLLVAEIQKRQPQAKLLLLGIFPRGKTVDDPWRPGIKQVNAELARLDDGKQIFFMDIGGKFLADDGSISPEIMPDALHPTEKGYGIWVDAMLPKVKELLGVK